PVGEAAAAYAIGDTPVWDDAAAAAALAGNRDNVAALRQLFLAELPAARDRIVAAASYGDDAGVRDALHRLHASCGFVGAARLDAAGRALREAPACEARLQAFLDAVNQTAGQARKRPSTPINSHDFKPRPPSWWLMASRSARRRPGRSSGSGRVSAASASSARPVAALPRSPGRSSRTRCGPWSRSMR